MIITITIVLIKFRYQVCIKKELNKIYLILILFGM